MLIRAVTAVVASAAVALVGVGASVPARAADPTSPLVLRAPDRVVALSYDGRVYSGLGIQMIAQGEAFEIQAHRPGDYQGPISAFWHREGMQPLPLPDGAMSTWMGLDDFATIKVLRGGERIRRIKAPGCFNGEARKVGPAGPVTNPYPWGCPWNPYTLGSMMGVAEDYSASLIPEWSTSVRLRPGSYEVVAKVSPQWRDFFGISLADGRTTTELVVKKRRVRDEGSAARTAAAAPRDDDADDGLEETTSAPTSDSSGVMANAFAPDLRSLPAFAIGLNGKGTAMRFGATVWNGGAGPMVIEGFREMHDHAGVARRGPGDHDDHMTAYQYYFDGNGNQTGYDQVGEFNYHAANHDHWHFRDFARYNLYGADEQGNRIEDIAVKSTKASFCLVATDAVDLTIPNADMRPEYTDLGSQCGGRDAETLRQVLANGHGDTYHQYRSGQAFRIGNQEKVPDGIYYIGVEANPADQPGAERDGRNLQELDYANNESFRKVRIFTGAGGQRRVKAFRVGVIDESSGFEFSRALR